MNYSQFSNSVTERFDAMVAEAQKEAETLLEAFASDELLEQRIFRDGAGGDKAATALKYYLPIANFSANENRH